MADDTISFSIRMPKALRDEVDRLAEAEGISTAKQIIRFVEAGVQGAPVSEDGLGVLARKVREIESITGAAWQADVKTYGAVKKVADRFFSDDRPIPQNHELIHAAKEAFAKCDAKLRGLLEDLEVAGVIERRESGPLLGDFISAPRRASLLDLINAQTPMTTPAPANSIKLVTALRRFKYTLAVPSEVEARTWELLDRDGIPLADADKVQLSAMLGLVAPWVEEWDLRLATLGEQLKRDDELIKEGEALVPDRLLGD